MNHILDTPIEFLKGVGPQRAHLLQAELGIFTFKELLEHYPFRYLDRSTYHKIKDLPYVDNYVQIKGVIQSIKEIGSGRGKKMFARFSDETGSIDLVWFQGFQWIKPNLKLNTEYQVFGRAKVYGSSWNIPHPELTLLSEITNKSGLQAFYSSTEKLNAKGLHSKGIEKLVGTLLPQLKGKLSENLPEWMLQEHHLISREAALFAIHLPDSEQIASKARFRLKFEELFFLQLEMLLRKESTGKKLKGYVFEEVGNHFSDFYENHLPFQLTNAQKRVIKEIRKDFLTGKHMNRLLQGDVGSGKTLVALLTMLIGIGNGFQAAIMAPTEILANQHFIAIKDFLSEMNINIGLLTGSVKKKDRILIHEQLINGEMDILVGTHALLEDVVQFKNLGIVVIDEQHRFGVAQRAKMWRKNLNPPHVLIMTATPIPRTLAMTFYGDLDVSVIDELPPGRKPISTIHKFESYRLRLFGFMKEQIALGRQIYIVYPLINESETLDFNNLMDGFEAISRSFPKPQYQVSIVHGQMKPEDKDYEMQRFVKGETHIMVATTVIEVGVNVPNASVMVIESAERFGLSQLHQLRGRVGRGAEKSYCILMTGDKISKESMKRMETMVQSNDGFEISEVDLQLRGPGDLMGTQQSGVLDLKISNLARDGQIVTLAREAAKKLLEEDPQFILPEHQSLKEVIRTILKKKPNWGRIA
ncbi:MAG: ATP-dependent DNA helicase RecG [Flavobacteriales bacterium]|nr:ATP-dependent DNA helicase RecG [Flavobacteriales bacterium]NCA19995.1 ATP-dependent DNA helicase RecG [Crocinitomicaceae bacterium]